MINNSYIVIDLLGQILGEFETEEQAHKFADGLKVFSYVEQSEEV